MLALEHLEHARFAPGEIMRMISLLAVKETLDGYKAEISGGNYTAILRAVHYCGEENLPMPAWLAQALSERLKKLQSKEGPHSLDELFGDGKSTLEKRRKQAHEQNHNLALYVHAASAMAQAGLKLDEALERAIEAGR